jgi:hypothetical protein
MAATKQAWNFPALRPVLALVVLLACAATVLPAQNKKAAEQTRNVQGVVSAPDETPLEGAVVQLKNTKTLQIRSFITQKDGNYYFHGLSPDIDYELKAGYQGTFSGTKTLSSFDSRKDAVINLKMNPKN